MLKFAEKYGVHGLKETILMDPCVDSEEESDENDEDTKIVTVVISSNNVRVRVERPQEDPMTEEKRKFLKDVATCRTPLI